MTAVVLKSNVTPPITVDLEAALVSSGGTGPSVLDRLLGIVRPSISLVTPLGNFSKAPAGEPGERTWFVVWVAIGGLLLAGACLAVYGLVQLLRLRRR